MTAREMLRAALHGGYHCALHRLGANPGGGFRYPAFLPTFALLIYTE
jgi:hypothetical protein